MSNKSQIVLCYFGPTVPEYIKYTIQQLRIDNPDTAIDFLVSPNANTDVLKGFSNLTLFEDPPLDNSSLIHNAFAKYNNPLWATSFERIFRVARHIRKYAMANVWHFDADVMVYTCLDNHIPYSCEKLSITRGSYKDYIFGMSFIPHYSCLSNICDYLNYAIKNEAIEQRRFGLEMLNEMVLVRIADKLFNCCALLPSAPGAAAPDGWDYTSPYTLDSDGFFDPAGYGQFLGGSPHNGNKPGFTDANHYIGRLLANGEWDCVIIDDAKNGKRPYLLHKRSGWTAPILSLHIHSKNTKKFLSY